MVLKHSVQISQFLHMYQYELGAHAIKHLIVHVFNGYITIYGVAIKMIRQSMQNMSIESM